MISKSAITLLLSISASVLFALPPAMTPEDRQRQLDSFDHVWQTIHDKHWEAKPGGLDWDQVRAELRPKAEKAQSSAEIRELIREMLHRLKQSHFNLLSFESVGDMKDLPSGDGVPGFEAQVIGPEALVTHVDANLASVKMGWQIVNVDGVDITERIRAVSTAYKGNTEQNLRLFQMLRAHLSGQPGSKVPMEFRNEQGASVKIDVSIHEPKGKPTGFGNLPPVEVNIESRQLEGPIGYVRFNLFLDPVRLMQTFSQAVAKCNDKCQGFIIDVRGNPGGLGIMASSVAGWFVEKNNLRLGSMYTRDSTLNFVVNPRATTFNGKLAILIDGASASTSEIFAGGMQDLHRARIFGERSAAAALPSIIEKLPNGDGFQYAMANYISEGGKSLEGNGVKPDEEVHLSRQTLLAGHDAVIDAAVSWIQKRK